MKRIAISITRLSHANVSVVSPNPAVRKAFGLERREDPVLVAGGSPAASTGTARSRPLTQPIEQLKKNASSMGGK